jgi:hypothetical protein
MRLPRNYPNARSGRWRFSDELKFRLPRATNLSPVDYKRVAEANGKEVPWEQKVGRIIQVAARVTLKDATHIVFLLRDS